MLKNSEFYETLVDGIGKGIKKPKADFEENDPKSSGYIKNRTHWKEEIPEKNVVIADIPKYEYTGGQLSAVYDSPKPIIAGKTYTIEISTSSKGDYSYEATAFSANNGLVLDARLDGLKSFTGQFLFVDNKIKYIGSTSGYYAKVKITYNEPAHTVYHPIDQNYLPYKGSYIVIIEQDEDGNYILSKSTPYKDMVKAFEDGCAIFAFDNIGYLQCTIHRDDHWEFQVMFANWGGEQAAVFGYDIDSLDGETGVVTIRDGQIAMSNDLNCCVNIIENSDGSFSADRSYDEIQNWLNQGKNVWCNCEYALSGTSTAKTGLYQLSGDQNQNAITFERMITSNEGLSSRNLVFSSDETISYTEVMRPFIKGVTNVYKSYHSGQLLAIASTSMGGIDSFGVVEPPTEYKVKYVNLTSTLDEATGKITGTSDITAYQINKWNADCYTVYAKFQVGESLTSMIPLVSVASGEVDFQGVYYFNEQQAVKIRATIDSNKKVSGKLIPLAEASQIGDLSDLATESKENLVAAINEVKAGGGSADAVLYTEQTLTEEQKAQARENIGGVRPIIQLEYSFNGAGFDWNYRSDEIQKFRNKGCLFAVNTTQASVSGDGSGIQVVWLDGTRIRYTEINNKGKGGEIFACDVNITGQVTADKVTNPDHETDLVQYAAFKAAVPMVQMLNISDAKAGQIAKIKTVNSSGNPTSWEAVDMPSGGSGTDLSLGLTSASVGQIIKVKAVDENGKPTQWEAADAAGGKLRWAQVLDMTTTEQMNIITADKDPEGRTFASYNAIAMLTVLSIPADSTQASTSGTVWVVAQPDGYNSRAIINFANWKTTSRTLSQCHLGTVGGLVWCGVANLGSMSSATPIDTIFSSVKIEVHNTDDHLPIGTVVKVFFLSEENA